jgi:hypothetical protein
MNSIDHLDGKCRYYVNPVSSTGEKYFKSFFTELPVCIDCFEKEKEIRQIIVYEHRVGADLWYQRCGYVPKV